MASYAPSAYFDTMKVTRLICLGRPMDEVIPHFVPLVKAVIKNSVAWDNRNHTEEDLLQVGLMKAIEVVERFDSTQGNLFAYAAKLIKHALWSEARLRPLDHQRVTDEVDFDTQPAAPPQELVEELQLDEAVVNQFRMEDPAYKKAAEYVFGVLVNNDFESNRARVLKTLTHGYDVNPKHARFLADHVLVTLRRHYSKGPQEVRDDALFDNKFKYTLVPELRELLGERAFERLIHYFGALTITIPSVAQIDSIDRDLAILKALAHDWTCGPTLSKRYGISPEGIKAVYKACLHKLHTDAEYRGLVSRQINLDTIPGFENPTEVRPKKKPIPTFGERRMPPRRRVTNTDSMGFTLGCRNSLLYTLIVTGKCSRADLVRHVRGKFGGSESAAKATVSAFLSDIKHPFGKFNTSRNLRLITDPKGRLSFEKESLAAAQKVIAAKRQAQMLQEAV
jgi:hypothetical protein